MPRKMSLLLVALMSLLAIGCGDDYAEILPVDGDGEEVNAPILSVAIPDGAGAGLTMAAEDMLTAWSHMSGAPVIAPAITPDEAADFAVSVSLNPESDDALGEQGYRITNVDGKLEVVANTEIGAMYALYDIQYQMGVRYFHPEETFYPESAPAALPTDYDGRADIPRFNYRGFHEHTQHPIVMSDFYLRPDGEGFREYLSHYARWLARNRQNMASFHMLKTVDLETWLPYIGDYIQEANSYGIEVGMVIGFADQQQNAFKLVREDEIDPDTGELMDDVSQISMRLDQLMTAGFNWLGFQIGTSEFSKPPDQLTIDRMKIVVDYLDENHPGVRAYAWIHTTCDLKADDGGYYYHIPLKADERFGAFVHTTMFYTLDSPAPVYACEDFTHQLDFIEQANGKREQIFFPESAWWLGFDDNLPLVNPITGYSRQYDIQTALDGYDINGHLTFTSGREWTYWQYDHFLTQITWDGDLTWEDYLDDISEMYGNQGSAVASAIKAWTSLQVKHFYEETPLIYFYLAGELPADEIGAQAGILARRPKIPFRTVVDYSAEEFAEWSGDLNQLIAMRDAYQNVLDGLPETMPGGTALQQKLYREIHNGLYIYVERIKHALALYNGVVEVRKWVVEERAAAAAEPPRDPDESIKDAAMDAANEYLETGKAISENVISIIAEAENDYRYPVELLAREKPESLTSYPFGYLEETSRGFFWTRRDDQLETLIGEAFGTLVEEWSITPDQLFLTNADGTNLTVPDDILANSVISSFIPQLLFGLNDYDGSTMKLVLAQDHNTNLKPDPETEGNFIGNIADGTWEGTSEFYSIGVRDSTGASMGSITIISPIIQLVLVGDDSSVSDIESGQITGEIASDAMIALITSVGGIDTEGASNLVKGIYGYETDEELPARLPMGFSFEFEEAR